MRPIPLIKGYLQRIIIPFHWLFVRLPRAFSLPLLATAAIYFSVIFPGLVTFAGVRADRVLGRVYASVKHALEAYTGFVPKAVSVIVGFAITDLVLLTSAIITLLVAIGGVLACHWVAGNVYWLYRRVRAKPFDAPVPVAPGSETESSQNNPLAKYKRIGIILSGGGAKGAYQAGAMRAIYEFLEEHGAHKNVQMIAGTSIGSWNALFWLADLIKSNDGGPGPLERWWSGVNVQNIILPIRYVPTRQNYLLSNQPWQDNFDGIFRGTAAGRKLAYHAQHPFAEDAIRFYFTHSNIGKAQLAFTTNRNDCTAVTANMPNQRPRPVLPPDTYRVVSGSPDNSSVLENIRVGVFSSMDIPPLFPYTSIGKDFFEDGGVIDNLPIRFGTEVEECDLLFILPLNASFERTVDQRSLIRRLARVTEIRQGVLERNSFKMIYLYNELASLRDRISELERAQPAPEPDPQDAPKDPTNEKIAKRAFKRTHRVVHVFSICPAPELQIGTTEFWKTREAARAFQFMYEVTKNELKKFTNIVNSNQIRMALVSPARKVRNDSSKNGDESVISDDPLAGSDSERPILKTTDKVSYYVTYFRDF